MKTKIMNILISGTNFWNPGDDFVRDGVITVLRALVPDHELNFLFYNFNADFFPQSKFSGISNTIAQGDLEKYGHHVDAIVIAGLSAGAEIKDLYSWVIKNNLHDRVYLIGAGYENSYVDRYIYEEPEATIFKNARIITGRTRKTPRFIPDLKLPYKYINCPAILSVPKVKDVPEGKKIETIGFSIQLPHSSGVVNHACAEEMYHLATETLFALSTQYTVEIVAHHKTEYFHFLDLLKGKNIPVRFSSFYQDLFAIYPRYDLMVTTRLHASLFANGFGIPGIILNDTDRHTHCLEGFPHSVWVHDKSEFDRAFNQILGRDLARIASDAAIFKNDLLEQYIAALGGVFPADSPRRPAGDRTGLTFSPELIGVRALIDQIEEPVQELPVHIFSIVLNGEPFIRRHIETFKNLPFPWHWHIVEGVADLTHDTAWSLQTGGCITPELHRGGLSNDSTTEYLDTLQRDFPSNVTVYRKGNGLFWDGKLEMVNAPLESIKEECLLFQVDADEVWTADQIREVRTLFLQDSERTAAFYRCNYFVGPGLVITSRNTYGNHTEYEWLRTWRFRPGDRWTAHEPPCLCRRNAGGEWIDLAIINPFLQPETEAKNLIFDHFAYVTEKQLLFKEVYYGYANAVTSWQALQGAKEFPLLLRNYLPWVTDGALVDRPESDTCSLENFKSILWIRSDAIGDNILSASMLPHIRKRYSNATITVVCEEQIAELYKNSPAIDGVITFDRTKISHDEVYRTQFAQTLRSEHAEVVLNSVFSRDTVSDFLALSADAPLRIAWEGDLCNMSADENARSKQGYSRLLGNSSSPLELVRHREFLKGIAVEAESLVPTVLTSSEDESFAAEFFTQNSLVPEKTIAFFSGTLRDIRRSGQYGDALVAVCAERDFSVLCLGGAEAHDACEQLGSVLTGLRHFNLAGKTTICKAAALIRRCTLSIGPDTGLAHIACAVGTPNVVLMGGGHFGRFFPYSPSTSIVCLPLECYACNWQCRHSRVHCLQDISPATIQEAMCQTLAGPSDKPRVFVQVSSHYHRAHSEPRWYSPDRYLAHHDVHIIPVGSVGEKTDPVWQKAEEGIGAGVEERSLSRSAVVYEGAVSTAHEGKIREAIAAMEQLLDKNPFHTIVYNDLGVLYLKQNDQEKALWCHQEAVRRDPDNILFKKNLADLYYVVLGRLDDAISIYKDILEKHPDDFEALIALGQIYIIGLRYPAAIEYLHRARVLDPSNATVSELLDLTTGVREGQETFPDTDDHHSKEAERMVLLKDLLSSHPDLAQPHYELGALLMGQGNITEAIFHYEQAVKLQPANATFLKNLADIYLVKLNRSADARLLYLSVLAIQPHDLDTLLISANISLSLKELHAAVVFYTRALDLAPENSDVRSTLEAIHKHLQSNRSVPEPAKLHQEALNLANAGFIEDAIPLLENLLRVHPNFAVAHNDLGVLHTKRGNLKKAREHYVQATTLEPLNFTTAKNLADFTLVALGRTDEAIQMYAAILERHPDDIETLLAKGRAHLAQDNFESAGILYKRVLALDPANPHAGAVLAVLQPDMQSSHRSESVASASVPDLKYQSRIDNSNRPSWSFNGAYANEEHKTILDMTKDIPGWQAPGDSYKLYEMGYYAGSAILEIGTYAGRSAVVELKGALGNVMRMRKPQYFGIDVDKAAVERTRRTLEKFSLLDYSLLFCGDAEQFMNTYDISPSMVFVDGDHRYEGVKKDTILLRSYLDPNIPVLFHDYLNAENDTGELGVRRAVNEWESDGYAEIIGVFGCSALMLTTDKCIRKKRSTIAERRFPKETSLKYEEAVALVREGKTEDAIANLESLLVDYPDFSLAHNDLGVLYTRKGKVEKALVHYEQAVKLEPSNITSAQNLADFIYVALGQIDDAHRMYTAILELQPENIGSLVALGQMALVHGRLEEAKSYFQKILRIDPSNIAIRQSLVRLGDSTPSPEHLINPFNFGGFTYSKESHFSTFGDYDLELFGRRIDPQNCDLKAYQDLLVFGFILQNIPRGARILEIGGGDSRILKAMIGAYECWDIDKMEGIGNGPTEVDSRGYHLVNEYMGNFSKELPENYFDFVFSISALEHVDENQENFSNICRDIDRVLKSGGYSLHVFDVVLKKDSVWCNKLVPFMFHRYAASNSFIPLDLLLRDPDIYTMHKTAFSRLWEPLTKMSYEAFGKPASYNILWQKPEAVRQVPDQTKATAPHSSPLANCRTQSSGGNKEFMSACPKIAIVTPSFNQGSYLEECIDSVLSQNYPNLEYIVMDGGSTDSSVEIIKKYENHLTYWQSRPDGGQYRAVNEGFQRTTGEIMTWLNSDDKFHPGAFEIAADIFSERPDVEWITGRPNGLTPDGTQKWIQEHLPAWNRAKYLLREYWNPCVQQEGTFWRRKLWVSAGGGMSTQLQLAGDLELWARFFRYAHLHTVDALLAGFRHHPGQKTAQFMDQYYDEADAILDLEQNLFENGQDKILLAAPLPIVPRARAIKEPT